MSSKSLVAVSAPSFPAVTLPNVSVLSSPMLAQLTSALGVPRGVVAADHQIDTPGRSSLASSGASLRN